MKPEHNIKDHVEEIKSNKRTVAKDLSWGLMIIIIIVSCVIVTTNHLIISHRAAGQLDHKAEEYLDNLTSSLQIPLWNFDEDTVRKTAQTYLENEYVAKMRVIDSAGNVLFNRKLKKAGALLEKNENIIYENRLIGRVEIGLTPAPIIESNRHILYSNIFLALIIITVVFLAANLLLKKFLKDPLDHLLAGIERIADGEYEHELPDPKQREISEIISKFNHMSLQIRDRQQALEEMNRQLGEEIKERMNAEDKQEKLQQQLSNAVDIARLGHWEYDVLNDLFTFNDHFYKIYRTTADEAGGYTMSSADYARRFVHPDDIPIVQNELQKIYQDAPSTRQVLEHRIVYPDGDIAYIGVRYFFVRDEDGRLVKTYGVNQDITESKLAEDTLREKNQLIKEIIDSIQEGLIVYDPDLKYQVWNPFMERYVGIPAPDVLGRHPLEIFPFLDGTSWLDSIKRALSGETPDAVDISFRSPKTDNIVWVSDKSSPLRNAEGEIIGVIATVRDITENKKIAIHLQQAQKMEAIGTLAGGIAHDFNNILSPIIGFTEILKDEIPKESILQSHITQILLAAERSRELVKQILAFSRKGDQDIRPIKIQPIIIEALKLLRSSIPINIEIQQDIDPKCGILNADPTQIHQIIMNLVTNAYHAVENNNGHIKVTLKEARIESSPKCFPQLAAGIYALLIVADTGVGIEKENLSKILDPYFTTKKDGKGTGLGLSVVQGIVTSYQGDMHIYSEPGAGTEFQIYLPLLEQNEENSIDLEMTPIVGGSEKILLVDDEEVIVDMEKHMLEKLGYRVEAHNSSLDALKVFQTDPQAFDLVITDMTMPKLTGEQLSRELLSVNPDIPIIICTGFSEKMDKQQSVKMGIRGFLMKPASIVDLAQMVRGVLDGEVA